MKLTSVILFTLLCAGANAGTRQENGAWSDPSAPNEGTSALRTEFISYDIRELAEKGDLNANRYYLALKPEIKLSGGIETLSSAFDVPYMWLDRDVFLRVEGMGGFSLAVNGRHAGYGGDSRVASEFNISQYISDGRNSMEITRLNLPGGRLETAANPPEANIYIFSQPKVRIKDYSIRFEPDTTGTHGVFDLEITMSNSYNSTEQVSVGFDVYSPQKLEHFDIKPYEIGGNRDTTIRITASVWRTPDHKWSSEYAGLYRGMLIVKRGNRFVEYIPYKVGFGTTRFENGRIYRNGKEIAVKAARYNHADSKKSTSAELAVLKKQGINTVCTDYPQPMWFYEACDAAGMYVIDQAGINNGPEYGKTDPAGSLANDPEWLNTFMSRVESAYMRARNHTCIIGWSLGGDVGNGFNMYRCYLWLKGRERFRPVIFNDAQGQWNSDTEPIQAVDAKEILKRAAAKAPVKRK